MVNNPRSKFFNTSPFYLSKSGGNVDF